MLSINTKDLTKLRNIATDLHKDYLSGTYVVRAMADYIEYTGEAFEDYPYMQQVAQSYIDRVIKGDDFLTGFASHLQQTALRGVVEFKADYDDHWGRATEIVDGYVASILAVWLWGGELQADEVAFNLLLLPWLATWADYEDGLSDDEY